MKVLVLYVFHVVNNRVKHFIEKCMFEDSAIHFILISNGNNNFYYIVYRFSFKFCLKHKKSKQN